jgi:hypothetical protein
MAQPLVNPAINRIAARLEPTLRRAFESAVRQLQAQIGIEAVIVALERNDVTPEILAALANFPKQLEPVGRVIKQTYVQAGESAANHLARHLDVSAAFNLTNPRAVTWAATHVGRLITTDLVPQTQQAVRTIIARAFAEGIPPREAAKLIRPMFGLNNPQAEAVMNYYDRLIAEGRKVDEVAGLAQRYTAKLQRQRSLTIARTETITAAGAGQQEAWRQASEDGYLDAEESVKQWLTKDDERNCAVCWDELHETKVTGLETMFECTLGSFLTQPAHPNCRCDVIIWPA